MTLPKRRLSKNQNGLDEDSKAKFPSARYFQIHFQQIEQQLELANRRMGMMEQQITKLQALVSNDYVGFDEPSSNQ